MAEASFAPHALKGQKLWKQHALKGQKLLAQGNTLGIIADNKAPCKGKSLIFRGKMKFFEKKVKKDAEKFGGMKKKHYLCTRF